MPPERRPADAAARARALAWLHDASYQCLAALCPQLPRLDARPAVLVARPGGLPALELQVRGGSRHTADLRLAPLGGAAGPRMELRAYHDSRQAEPLRPDAAPWPGAGGGRGREVWLERRLADNRRLLAGLRRCLGAGYHFAPNARPRT